MVSTEIYVKTAILFLHCGDTDYLIIHLIIGRYFARFSIITQRCIARSTNAIGSPDGAYIMLVKSIPIITGKIIIAPSALVLVGMKSIPPSISAVAIRGINQLISIKAPIAFI